MDHLAGLPDVIRIGPFDFTVLVRGSLDDPDDWGNYSSCLLEFRREQPNEAFAVDTVLHEINHALFAVFAIKKADNEERVSSIMATGWTQVFRDNPELLEWIAGRLK